MCALFFLFLIVSSSSLDMSAWQSENDMIHDDSARLFLSKIQYRWFPEWDKLSWPFPINITNAVCFQFWTGDWWMCQLISFYVHTAGLDLLLYYCRWVCFFSQRNFQCDLFFFSNKMSVCPFFRSCLAGKTVFRISFFSFCRLYKII